MNFTEILWQTKLHARLHDPAEKALVLMRDPAGHERGTSRALWRLARANEESAQPMIDNDNAEVLHAVAFADGIRPATYTLVQRADWWAAAADRPQWPLKEIPASSNDSRINTFAVADFAQVHWAKVPQLIHPLCGTRYDLKRNGDFSDIPVQNLKLHSYHHFSKLLCRDGGKTDFKKSLLAFWRFGPEVHRSEASDSNSLGALWGLLPADTRIPDHSIWDHLDLTSAFAGAFAADPNNEAALLSLSIGPVQSFIEAARSTSDLWAGSHLLSRLAWEAMKPVCEQLGPDAILFPRLRGVPQVDVWLRDACKLPKDWFDHCEWTQQGTDANPLFSAAVPNRFVAIVPAAHAKALAEQVELAVQQWMQSLGKQVVDELLKAARMQGDTCYQQMKDQLHGFPEVHWAAVPFSLIRCGDTARQRNLDTELLSAAMRPFFSGSEEPGFLDSPAWKVLRQHAKWDDGTTFFAPNPGVLYPAVYELAERLLAAAKSTRRFDQTEQSGWRCSLTGETEWLTTHRDQLTWTKSHREAQGTLWTELAGRYGIKKGEHLGALPAIKRLWPSLFASEAGAAIGSDTDVSRFVVSTHAMALASSLAEWLPQHAMVPDALADERGRQAAPVAALPRKLIKLARKHSPGMVQTLGRIPAWLEDARESGDEGKLNAANQKISTLLGKKPEAYYALLMMDGDHMGKWLSGANAIPYRDSFHDKVREGIEPFANKHSDLEKYFSQHRALSPNRHLAISAALNDFSLHVVRHVVEEEFMGRLIYAGGDDVLAMLPISDLLPCMSRLRAAYSGHDPNHTADSGSLKGLNLSQGFARLDGKLMRMMGTTATASIGAVIAHHQAPLSAVMRELRNAEKRAKNEGGRDAFSITVIKRSGGDLRLTEKWDGSIRPMDQLQDLILALRSEASSRRATYLIQSWGIDLPEPGQIGSDDDYRSMVQQLMHYQFQRQKVEKKGQPIHSTRLSQLMPVGSRKVAMDYVNNFLSVADFLARESRAFGGSIHKSEQKVSA